MNVYLGPSQSLMKNAYIGEVYEYSYDFRNKSTSIITADGWSYNNAPSFDSNGMYYSSWVSRNFNTLGYNLNSAKKITLKFCFVITNSSNIGGGCGILKVSGVTNFSGMYFDATPVQQVQINNSTISTYNVSKSNGAYTETMEYNLENKTYTYSGFFTSSGSLTDTQISGMKNSDGLYVGVGNGGWRASSVILQIEY